MKYARCPSRCLMLGSILACTVLLACGGGVEKKAEETTEGAHQAASEAQNAQAAELVARAELSSPESSMVRGVVTFTENNGQVHVVARLEGVQPPGPHGIHVHETGQCVAPDYASAGGHFNPTGTSHACPPTEDRHAGDLGNVVIAEDGTGTLDLTTDLLTVSEGPLSVVGRSVILHSGEDDCTSQPSGASGNRIACGVIALVGTEPSPPEGQEPPATDVQ